MSALQIAGALGIFIAVGHGWMGDKNLRQQPLEPAAMCNFIRAAYQFGTAGWLGCGVLLLASPSLAPGERRTLSVVTLAVFAFGAIVNAWFTKGRHPGWVLLALTCALITTGL